MGALLGAVTSGLLPLDGAWWVQGLTAAIPTALVFFSAGLFMLLRDIFFSKPGEKPRGLLLLLNTSGFTLMLAPALVLGAASFALGAGASFFPGLALGAGIVSIGLIIIAAGAATLVQALRTGDRMWSRVGLTILGGFVAAGFILAADAAVKAIESLNSL